MSVATGLSESSCNPPVSKLRPLLLSPSVSKSIEAALAFAQKTGFETRLKLKLEGVYIEAVRMSDIPPESSLELDTLSGSDSPERAQIKKLQAQLDALEKFTRRDRERRLRKIERSSYQQQKISLLVAVTMFLGMAGISYQDGRFTWLLDTQKAQQIAELVGSLSVGATVLGAGAIVRSGKDEDEEEEEEQSEVESEI